MQSPLSLLTGQWQTEEGRQADNKSFSFTTLQTDYRQAYPV